jgi:hypothetical protein
MQGYLPVVASILDVEVWGLGGQTVKHQQDVYKKREDIFSGQRRKVLLGANSNPLKYITTVKIPQKNLKIPQKKKISPLLKCL